MGNYLSPECNCILTMESCEDLEVGSNVAYCPKHCTPYEVWYWHGQFQRWQRFFSREDLERYMKKMYLLQELPEHVVKFLDSIP